MFFNTSGTSHPHETTTQPEPAGNRGAGSGTLVIHPTDPSTDFLRPIWEGRGSWTVLRDPCISQEELRDHIADCQRLVCLGHGSPGGLFGAGAFLIHGGLVPLLRERDLVAIWCHADRFLANNALAGFCTGMFISEVGEAWLYGLEAGQEEIDASNRLFAALVARYLDEPDLPGILDARYQVPGNPVVRFNRARLQVLGG